MLVTEHSLARAVRTFIGRALIPRPAGWTKKWDEQVVKQNIFPAFMEALNEIEAVEPNYGFDLNRAAESYCKGEDMKEGAA